VVQTCVPSPSPRWTLREADTDRVMRLQEGVRIHPLVAKVLVARGITEERAAMRYLDPRLSHLSPPSRMAGLEQATRRLGEAVQRRELIGVFGDYDVDGLSASVLIADYLRRAGGRITIRVARREEGYGLGVRQVEEMVGRGCSLLVVADCGTSDHAAVAAATAKGVDVVAVDHHRVTREDWPGLALVNPQRPDCGFPFKGLTSVGLAFYVMASLRRFLEHQRGEAPDPRESLDLVALGTVADVAPLEAENRVLVSRGLIRLGNTRRPGLRELMRLANVSTRPGRVPTSDEVGWRIGPRLNAPGRLGDASISLDCLWERDADKGILSARRCDALNEQRKAIQARVETEALALAQEQVERGQAFILVSGQHWHPGVIGIVAARLASTFRRPAAAVALTEGEGKGSARSVPQLDLVGLLTPCSEQMIRFGGHAAAAGFSVLPDRIPTLHRMLHELTGPQLAAVEEAPLTVESLLRLDEVEPNLCRELAKLGPHGCANPEPVFAAADVVVQTAQTMAEQHIRLRVSQGGTTREAVGFGMADRLPEPGERVQIAFLPEIDELSAVGVRLRLIDLRRAGDAPPLAQLKAEPAGDPPT
jgi:single-stranded-DNA-specific exonuclease